MTTDVANSTSLVKLKSRQEVAERTMAFRLEKPAGFAFTPGQFVEITLLSPPRTDEEGNSRAFSIASAPDDDFIMVATRLRDTAFKQVLPSLPPGVEVKMEGPFGDLKLHNDASRTAVLLAGGIGVTPLRSILLHAAKRKLAHRIFFFYANRRPEDAAFLDELQGLEKENPNYRLIACMSQMEKSRRAWQSERGVINAELLGKHLAGVASPIYYVTGPPAMVKAMHATLNGMGVDDDNIRTEEFAGY